MTLKTVLRTCGASALAVAVALGAFTAPASAQDRRERDSQRSERSEGRPTWSDQRAQRPQQQAERPQRQQRTEAAPQARQQRSYDRGQAQAAPQRPSGDWNRGDRRSSTGSERMGRDWNRRDNTSNDWGQQRAAQAQAEAQQRAAQAQAQAAARSSRGDTRGTWGSSDRNRSYTDRQRNQTYRDGYRDGRQTDWRQDRQQTQNAYRSGYRDGVRTDGWRDGDRDGRRYDGNRDGRRYSGDYRRWTNDWRRDNRYDWYRYRSANRNVFNLGAYYSPYRNYRYNRVSIGFTLGSLFYGSRYWINDPWQYRLPPAYGPYRWVRYYDDALLVDVYSGEVVDVIYDFFW